MVWNEIKEIYGIKRMGYLKNVFDIWLVRWNLFLGLFFKLVYV